MLVSESGLKEPLHKDVLESELVPQGWKDISPEGILFHLTQNPLITYIF